MNLTPRDRRAIVLGAGALAALLAVRFALLPWWESWGEAREEARACRAGMDSLEVRIRRLANLQDRAVKTYGPSAAEPLLESGAARIAFTKAVQDALRTGGIQFESITPQPDRFLTRQREILLVPFQVQGKCDLSQLARCLADMRKAPMPMIVDRLRVTTTAKEPGKLELSMVLATLARKEGNAP